MGRRENPKTQRVCSIALLSFGLAYDHTILSHVLVYEGQTTLGSKTNSSKNQLEKIKIKQKEL